MAQSGQSRHCNNLSAIGIRADIEGFGWRCERRRCGQPKTVFVVYRHDETGLASQIETVEIISLGLEDHGLRSHALKRLVPKSGVLPPDTFF
jgi:hypothetical protein